MNIEDYTQEHLADVGTFRAFPVSWTVEASTTEGSQAVCIVFRFAIRAKWHPSEKAWSQDWADGYFTEGRVWVVKKDGSFNTGAIENLSNCGLWDGDFDSIAGPVANTFVLIEVAGETYQGTLRYRAEWINPNADEPAARGGLKPADPSLLATLRSRFQSGTKAIAGGNRAGFPGAPPKAAPAAQPAGVPAAAPAAPAAPAALTALTAPQKPMATPNPGIASEGTGEEDDPHYKGDTPF